MAGEVVALSVGTRAGQLTQEAMDILRTTQAVAGFGEFLSWVRPHLPPGADIIADETPDNSAPGFSPAQICYIRAQSVVDRALRGQRAVLLSGGDAGLFGMAAALNEAAARTPGGVTVRTVPGISAVFAAAAGVGAPLTDGFATFSLAHSHVPWDRVSQRVRAALEGDLVLVLLEPVHEATEAPAFYPERLFPHLYPLAERDRERLEALRDLVCACRGPDVPMGIVSEIGRNERACVIRVADLMQYRDWITYRTVLIVGNSKVRVVNGRLVATYW